ncbi:MAG TPA: cbb3-type cytochrome c oxidase subunit 3 [Terriglobia bacterium]|nr:cbb3-type cytochrome c oxidase subunit 3 [Terriglobia bacterium]
MTLHEWSDFFRQYWVVWLLIFFGVIIFTAYRPKNRKHFDDCAQIPFRNDPEEQNHHG